MKYKNFIIGTLLALIGIFIYLNKASRQFIANIGVNPNRTILASLETEKLKGPHPFKILKVKEGDKLWLEIYFKKLKADRTQEIELHKKLPLEGQFDGHVQVLEQATNLALTNVDNDKSLEVLAPTYTKTMTPILNIYKYDPILEEFNEVDGSEILF